MNIAPILEERGKTHGEFADNAETAQWMKIHLRRNKGYENLSCIQREAFDAILSKIARAVSGNPNEPDHWKDIIGYATLVLDRLPK